MALLRRLRRNLVVIAGLATLAYMILPNIVVMVFSFNKPNGRFNYAWQHFSLDAWRDPCGAADLCVALAHNDARALPTCAARSRCPCGSPSGRRSAPPCSVR